MYNPYQRKLIGDMIMNMLLTVLLVINLLPVNIGARIVAEETPSADPEVQEVGDVGEQNDDKSNDTNKTDKKENPVNDDGISGDQTIIDEDDNKEKLEDPADNDQKIVDDLDGKDAINNDQASDVLNPEETDKDDLSKDVENKEQLDSAKGFSAQKAGATVEGGTSLRSLPTNQTIKIGDTCRFGQGADYIQTENGVVSYTGNHTLDSVTSLGNGRYSVKLSGLNAFVITSDGVGSEILGIVVTGGSNTRQSPYTLDIVFKKYTVTWKNYDEKVLETDENVVYGTTPTYDGKEPTRDPDEQYAYTFNGWTPEIQPVENDVIYTATYTEKELVAVTFDSNGGSASDPVSIKVCPGDAYGELPSVQREGYRFLGWYTEETEGTQVTKDTIVSVAEAHVLYAHWEKEYTVSFDRNHTSGTNPNSIVVTNGKPYGELPTITRTNYAFLGWFTERTGGTQITKDTIVDLSNNQTLYAHWGSRYQITFNANDGTAPTPDKKYVYNGQTYGELATTSKTNYAFLGWFTERTGGTQITEDTIVDLSRNQTLYAHWERQYTVSFDRNHTSGTNPDSIVVTNGKPYGELPTITRNNYTLLGWYTQKTGGTQVTKDTIVNLSNNQTLYAHWGHNYTVSFDGNGGTNPESKTVTNTLKYGTLPDSNRTGYRFQGWYTQITGGTHITEETTVNLSKNQILYAHWTANTYEVTFDKNGGETLSKESMNVTYDSAYGALAETTRTGYHFEGWFTGAEDGDQVLATDIVKLTDDQILYAHWTANTYEVTFDANGGKNLTPTSINVTYDSAYGVLATVERDNYTFVGWFTNDGDKITKDSTVSIADHHKLYAHWIGKEVKVSFNIGYAGGENPDPINVYYKSEYGQLPVVERNGYGFDGWWYTSGRISYKVSSDTTVNVPNNHTLTAKWTANTYTVTFDSNGGSTPSPSSKSVRYGSTYGDLPTVNKEGYSFAGWYTEKEGGDRVNRNTIVRITTDKTLYAHWTAKSYTVHFERNGGSTPSPRSKTVTYDSTYGNLATVSRDGYEFAGWYTKAIGGDLVTSTTKVTTAKEHYLYAHWIAKKFNITFDSNGGSNPVPATKEVIYDEQYGTLADSDRENYNLVGWFTAAQGGTQIRSNSKVRITTDQTLFAHWLGVEVRVSFNINYAGGRNPSSITVNYDSTYGRLPSVSRTGYTFEGWYDEETGGNKIESNTVVTETNNHTLYAHWKARTYTVTLHANGGTDLSPTSITVAYDSTYEDLNNVSVSRTGYELEGWYTRRIGGTKINPSDTVKITSGQTLYAHWTAKKFTVTFDSNGGSDPDPATKEVTYNREYGRLPEVDRNGYTFVGWYTDETVGTPVTSRTTVRITEDQTLYAHWTAIDYPIYYNNVSEATVTNPSKYTIEDSITLNQPVRTGYDFVGWTGSNGEVPQLIVTIAKGTTGELAYNANWLKIEYDNVSSTGAEHTRGVDGNATFTFKRNNCDDEKVIIEGGALVSRTFAAYVAADRVVKLDGNQIGEDKYIASSGSLIIELKRDYLDSLSIGEHTLTVDFRDGDALFTSDAKLIIKAKPADTPTYVQPTTGVHSDGSGLIRSLSMFALIALGATIKMRKKVGKDYWDEFK